MSFFHELDEDGVIDTVFSDEMTGAEAFLSFIKAPGNLVAFLVVDGVIAGMGWINGIVRNHAFAHFAYCKRSWGRESLRMGHKLLNYWFSFPDADGAPLFDVLVGNIPARNRLAIKYIEKLGFVEIGQIPKIADGESMSINYRVRDNG